LTAVSALGRFAVGSMPSDSRYTTAILAESYADVELLKGRDLPVAVFTPYQGVGLHLRQRLRLHIGSRGQLLRFQRGPDRGCGAGEVALPAGTPQQSFDTRLGQPAAEVGFGATVSTASASRPARSVPNAAKAAG
jgi:hypothetical protein